MILAVTGLQRERRILAGLDVEVVLGGDDVDRHASGKRGVISIGIAGALAPELKPGAWVVADGVHDGDATLPTDRDWTTRLVSRLPAAKPGLILGADTIAATAAVKAELHRATGAIAVDVESHLAARAARRHGLPFAAARVISDAAHRTLPPAARVGMRADGGIDLTAVLRSLLTAPWQLPALIRTGLEAETAFRALLRGRRLLGPGLAGPTLPGSYVGKLPADMV
jgi:hopanoid-associated phosphorylase